ncbi:MAG TPA: zf-HC2 domain-containing protein [Anaerolineae bacterium]|nr:zf-HC2 domain-containing protein [Anaerolineae bacterium]
MQCYQVEENLSAYLDGELKSVEHQEIVEHLKVCHSCAKILDDFSSLEPILVIPQKFNVPADLAQRLEHALDNEFERVYGDAKTLISNLSFFRRRKGSSGGKEHINKSRKQRPIPRFIIAASILAIIFATIAIASTENIIGFSGNHKIRKTQESRQWPENVVVGDVDDNFIRILSGERNVKPENIGYAAIVTVKSIDEAKKRLFYDFPVPTNTGGRKLKGTYIEDNSTLYIAYEGGIVIIYHAGYRLDVDEALKSHPDLFEVNIRGQRALARERGLKENPQEPRASESLGWSENGLHIAIYSYKDTGVEELIKIAESMK